MPYLKLALLSCVSVILIAPGRYGTAQELRPPQQEQYAQRLWDFLHRPGQSYREWSPREFSGWLPVGPPLTADCKLFQNRLVESELQQTPSGGTIVAEYWAPGNDPALTGISVWLRTDPSHPRADEGWYWIHFAADGTVAKTSADSSPYDKRGFVTRVEDGRLWVFALGSPELVDFLKSGEPAKCVTRPAAGPDGMTVKGPSSEVISQYLVSRPGFATFVEEGRIWVFRLDSPELTGFLQIGEPAKCVTRPAAGPEGMTVRSVDAETLDAYLALRP